MIRKITLLFLLCVGMNSVAKAQAVDSATISLPPGADTSCAGTTLTFSAVQSNDTFSTPVYNWYVNGVYTGVATNTFSTSTLNDGDNVYCELYYTYSGNLDSSMSNVIVVTINPTLSNSIGLSLTGGANPGCFDSTVSFTGTYSNFGTAPNTLWILNGTVVTTGTNTYGGTFNNGDVIIFQANETDGGCYEHDTLATSPFVIVRDSTPNTPLLSLISDLLVANRAGTYQWYGPPAYTLIPGATGQTYHPSVLGQYYCVLDSANCPSGASNIITISLLGVPNTSMADVKIYPNPTTGIITLDWGTKMATMNVDIYTILGQGIRHNEMNNQSHYNMDLSALPNGNYYLVLRNNEGSINTVKVTLDK